MIRGGFSWRGVEGGEGGREKNSWAGERWAPVPDRTDTVTGRV